MATAYAIDEIKKDSHELTRIAIEDNISKTQVINMFHPFKLGLVIRWSEDTILEEVNKYSEEEYVVSEIVGRPILSKNMWKKFCPSSPNIIAVLMT